MKQTKRRVRNKAEAKLDTLRTEVGRVLSDVARQIESATASVRGKLRGRGRPALPARSFSNSEPSSGRSEQQGATTGDTWPCPSSPEIAQRGQTAPWIRFEVQVSTEWGQEVVVVGNDPSLGNWSPQAGLLLHADKVPAWSGQTQLAASGFLLEYKYVRKNPDGSFTWESSPENRTFRVSRAALDRLMRDRVRWPA